MQFFVGTRTSMGVMEGKTPYSAVEALAKAENMKPGSEATFKEVSTGQTMTIVQLKNIAAEEKEALLRGVRGESRPNHGLFGLDQEIRLGDRATTIRSELSNGNGHTMRSFVIYPDKPEVSQYWVVIYKQASNSEMFEVSKVDLEHLRKEGVRQAFT